MGAGGHRGRAGARLRLRRDRRGRDARRDARAGGRPGAGRARAACGARRGSRPRCPGIYAAGDICEYDSVVHGRPLRVEHWDVAADHGKTAALNMLGRDVAARRGPLLLLRPGRLGVDGVRRARARASRSIRGSLDDGELHGLLRRRRAR